MHKLSSLVKDFVLRNAPVFGIGLFTLLVFIALIVLAPKTKSNVPVLENIDNSELIPTSAYSKGPEDAPITIVEYSDFECPACKYYYPIINDIAAQNKDMVRVVFRHFPLSMHKYAKPAAVAAQAAGKQGKFWEYADLLFLNQPNFTKDDLLKYAEQLNLNMPRFESDIQSKEINDEVEKDISYGFKIGLQFTPSIFINGKIITDNHQEYVSGLLSKLQKTTSNNSTTELQSTTTEQTKPQDKSSLEALDAQYGVLEIKYDENGFSPKNTKAVKGQLVRWVNTTSKDISLIQKTVLYDEFKSPVTVKANSSFEFRVYKPKLWTYNEKDTQAFGSIFVMEVGQ